MSDRPRHRLVRLLAALVLALAVVACGDDDASDSDAGTAPAVDAADDGSTDSDAGADGDGGDAGEGDELEDASEAEEPGDDAPGSDTPVTQVPTDQPAEDPPASDEDEGGDPLVFVADLSGEAEVPDPGAPDGTGRAEIESAGTGTLCFDMVASGLGAEVSAAHVHEGAAGAAGPVVIGIGLPTSVDGDTNTWTDVCVEVDEALVQEMAESPDDYYVNVHTSAHPGGAVRGQLETASIFDLTLS